MKVNDKMKRKIYTQIAGHGITEVLKAVKMACEEMGKIDLADYIGEAILEEKQALKRHE